MSENVGSQVAEVSPEVYRRRRIVALLILVLILLLIIGLISWLAGRGNSSDNATATASTSTSAEAFSDFSQRATESASPSESAEPSEPASASESASAEASESATPSESAEATASAEPTESAEATESAEPTASASPTDTVVAACTASDLQVNLTADRSSYAAGQNPALAVTYTNTSGNPCIVTGGAKNVDVNITSGRAQVYNYAKCSANPAEDAEVAAGATNTAPLTWNRSLNVLGCDTATTIQPGYYWATATVNGVASQPVRIIITG